MNLKVRNILKRVLINPYKVIKNRYNFFKVMGRQKIFVIGLNKTGATLLNKALVNLGIDSPYTGLPWENKT